MESYSKNIWMFVLYVSYLSKGGNVSQKIQNNSNITPTGDILCANYFLFQSGSLLLNNAVCLSYLFIKFLNEILDIAAYNGDTFILHVTIVSKEMARKLQFLAKESLRWKLLTDDEVLMPMLWSRDLSESWSHIYGELKNEKVAALVKKQFEYFLWMNLWSPITCYFSHDFGSFLFCFFLIRFCYRIKIFIHFKGAKHKAKETFLHCLLNKAEVSWVKFFVEPLFDCKTLPW